MEKKVTDEKISILQTLVALVAELSGRQYTRRAEHDSLNNRIL